MIAFLITLSPASVRYVSRSWSSSRKSRQLSFSLKRPRVPLAKLAEPCQNVPNDLALGVVKVATAAALCLMSPTLPFIGVHEASAAGAASLSPVNPGLLARMTPGKPVADLANIFAARQEERLTDRLAEIENQTGFKIRILTQTEGSAPGIAIKNYFGLDEKSVLIVADLRGGNILNFNVGTGVSPILPESFWIELGNRYGSKFYVRDNGEDGAVFATVDAIVTCLQSGKVCKAVPGFGRDQYAACLTCAGIGGAVAGASARTGGKRFNAPWVALFSPLWAIFFVSFGLLPVVSREGLVTLDSAGIVGVFTAIAAASWTWIPIRFGRSGADKTTPDV